MKPDDLIEGGLIRDSDFEGDPVAAAELGPFGRYVLLEEIGRGGAAIVYRALDPLLNRELALKRLRFGDPELEARFLREAELLARLSHSGIVPVFDFGREGDSHYYTMPLAAGLSLDRWILDQRPGPLDAARIVRQAAEALAHAHERGVLHRDVKPANILVNAEGAALLADFGLGRIEGPEAGESGRVTQSGEVMGTPSYMAPELATRDLKGADARCDVYSMGATLYEALTGRPPFIGRSSLEILKRATSEEPVPPRTLAPATPVDLEIVCLKALEKDPARRYATVRELADDLGRFLAGEPIRARRAGPLYRLRRFVGRRRAIVSVAFAGLLVAAGIGVFAYIREAEASSRSGRAAFHMDKALDHRKQLDRLLIDHREDDQRVAAQAEEAFGHIREALAAEPGHADAWVLKGQIHTLLFEKVEALECHQKAIALKPHATAHLERSIIDLQDLIDFLLHHEIPPSDPRVIALNSRIQEDLASVRKLEARRADLAFAEALLTLSKGTQDDCHVAASALGAYASRTSEWKAWYWKGMAEMRIGMWTEAEASLTIALRGRQNVLISAHVHERLGWALISQGRVQEAAASFRKSIDRDSRDSQSRFSLANLLFHYPNRRDEQLDEALRQIDEALGMAGGGDRPDFHAVRGLACVEKHKKAGGAIFLEKAKISLEIALKAMGESSPLSPDLLQARDYVTIQATRDF